MSLGNFGRVENGQVRQFKGMWPIVIRPCHNSAKQDKRRMVFLYAHRQRGKAAFSYADGNMERRWLLERHASQQHY